MNPSKMSTPLGGISTSLIEIEAFALHDPENQQLAGSYESNRQVFPKVDPPEDVDPCGNDDFGSLRTTIEPLVEQVPEP